MSGDAQKLGNYDLRMTDLAVINGPNYVADQATFEIYLGEILYKTVTPQKRRYNASGMVMTEAAIDSGFTRDLYIALGEPLGGGDWAVRLSLKPYVDWIWVGAFLMGLGGFVSITDKRRYRKRLERETPRRWLMKCLHESFDGLVTARRFCGTRGVLFQRTLLDPNENNRRR